MKKDLYYSNISVFYAPYPLLKAINFMLILTKHQVRGKLKNCFFNKLL